MIGADVWGCTFKMGGSFNMGESFKMRVYVCLCSTFNVCVCFGVGCGLWCPRICGGVVDGSQSGGGCIKFMPDSGGVS